MAVTDQEIDMHSSDFVPRDETVLVYPTELTKEEVSESGIVISVHRSSLQRPTTGRVVKVGGKIDWINENDYVIWQMTDGINLKFTDGDFLLLREKSLLGLKKHNPNE